MPIEFLQLAGQPQPLKVCPLCEAHPFRAFLWGQVQRSPFKWWQLWGSHRPYCAVICEECKEIVGYEDATKEVQP
jgi:hypothetical protein